MPALEHAQTLLRLGRNRRNEPDALRQFQLRKLRVLVAHCRRRVAIYREHWRGTGLATDAIAAPEDIAFLPTIGKNEFKSRPLTDALTDRAVPGRLVRHTTSGSSGQPFTIYRSALEEDLLNLFRLRAYSGAGLRLSDRIARFSQLPTDETPRRWPGQVRRALGVHRDLSLDGMAPAETMIERLLRWQPDVVAGYPSTLRRIAAEMRQRAIALPAVHLVLCGGEVLGASARRAIEAAFAAPVAEFYGAHEFNLLAAQCPRGFGYHVCDDNVLVEVVDGDGRAVAVGETGEVVATALHCYTMPFVRYRTGDLAIRGPAACECGAPFSTLRALEGRAADYLRLSDGRRVHPYAITGTLADRESDWVRQHQLVQIRPDCVVLRIESELSRRPRPEELERVCSVGAGVLGSGARFEVEIVERFTAPASGKFQPYVSLIGDSERVSADAR
ncbi:MAG TPA: AMP-binding protein [Casimicrobiaceae bacterium]|nr:AMP-binding protein [Casimicrobiaceae bacterium]